MLRLVLVAFVAAGEWCSVLGDVGVSIVEVGMIVAVGIVANRVLPPPLEVKVPLKYLIKIIVSALTNSLSSN